MTTPTVTLPSFGAVIPKLRWHQIGDVVEVNGKNFKLVRHHKNSVILEDSVGYRYWVWTRIKK